MLIFLSFRNCKKISSISYPASKYILPVFSSIISEDIKKPINDLELLKATREAFDYVIMSTGMSTEEEIKLAVDAANPDVIMHTNSTYPCPPEDLNLNYIKY